MDSPGLSKSTKWREHAAEIRRKRDQREYGSRPIEEGVIVKDRDGDKKTNSETLDPRQKPTKNTQIGSLGRDHLTGSSTRLKSQEPLVDL